jgi:hypothetical protein
MTASNDRVSIELIDAGEHKDRVALVLSKVKGLAMSPQQIVSSTPCTVATNVPRPIAEKLQGFLEQAGAMVMLESEEKLFSPSEFPLIGEEQIEAEPPEEFPKLSGEDVVSESKGAIPGFPESDFLKTSETEEPELQEEEYETREEERETREEERETEKEEQELETKEKLGKFQELISKLSSLGRTKEQAEVETEKPAKKSPLAFLSKFRKGEATIEGETELLEKTPAEVEISTEVSKPKISNLMSSPVFLVIIGFLAGAVVAGLWGWLSIRSLQKERIDYEIATAQQIEQHSAELKNSVQQLLQETVVLKQENATLKEQIITLTTQLEEARQPTSITPSQTPEIEGLTFSREALVKSFQELMAMHTQSLENGYEAQKRAGCTQQLLLDGKGTYTYAQVVKKFTSKYTTYDIMKSNSLLTPYVAEFKIPFQQEMHTGATKEACQAATLQQLETPPHPEFGGYYGIWTIQYVYTDGKWVVKPTVIERNRALYESAFQKGSPDSAKFLINTEFFPAFKAQ